LEKDRVRFCDTTKAFIERLRSVLITKNKTKGMKLGLSVNLVEKLIASRRQKASLLILELAQPTQNDVFLEVGGPSVELGRAYPRFGAKIIVNRDRRHMANFIAADQKLDASFVIGDGCNLPFADHSVDFCVSHATIEHTPPEYRTLFCKEMGRVATKANFITTPNFWFPFEFHYMVPFFQFLPLFMQKGLKRFFVFSHMSIQEEVALLKSSEIKALLGQSSKVYGVNRLVGIPATLLGYNKHVDI
jgi:hypothetical protein